MNADLQHLVVLQAQDLELRRLREELAAAPGRVRSAVASRDGAEAALNELHDSIRREEGLRRRQESDADDHRAKLARLRRQLATATSAAQITALEHEISFSEAAIQKLEDEELESLSSSEELELAQAKAVLALERAVLALTAEQARAAELKAKNDAELAAIESERHTVRAQIAETLLALYDRVARSRGTGIAEARDGQCTACRMKVRPQRWNDLIGRDHEDETFTCESCGRVLFYDPRRDTPGPWAAGDRLAAALSRAAAGGAGVSGTGPSGTLAGARA